MKKLIILIVLSFLPMLSFSQSIFDKYEGNEKVTFVSMQPKMFQMLAAISASTDDPEAQEFFNLVNSITSFKVITTEDSVIASDLNKWVASSPLDELMRVRDGDSNVKFYVKEGKDENHVKELLMFVTGIKDVDVQVNGHGIETVLLSLTGDIDLRQVAKLTDKMDLPGGKQLGKAGKK